MTKEYKVPIELQMIFSNYKGCIELRDKYARLPFGFKKALKASSKAQLKLAKFWREVYRLYPELRDKEISYNLVDDEIKVANCNINTIRDNQGE